MRAGPVSSAARQAHKFSASCCFTLLGKGKKSKKASKLTLSPEAEALLTHICVCLKFLVVTDNANCYRVAAAGCLPALVLLGAESKHTRLRTSAQVRAIAEINCKMTCMVVEGPAAAC